MMLHLDVAAFIDPKRLAWPGAWVGHIPFASWLLVKMRPNVLVELGTHTGNSYCAFCQVIVEHDLPTKAFAVDTWRGDEHAGYYGEEVFSELKEYHDEHYRAFSTLLRTTFDDASEKFSTQSIDILHIDGLHTYEAVRHDFETWLPKLSRRGVVLLHDTNVRRSDFGVHRLWDELIQQYPGFQFTHCHGLGVLLVGVDQSAELLELIDSPNVGAYASTAFESVGAALERRRTIEDLNQELATHRATINDLRRQLDAKTAERVNEVLAHEAELADLRQQLDAKAAERVNEVLAHEAELADLRQQLDAKTAERVNEVAAHNAELADLRQQRETAIVHRATAVAEVAAAADHHDREVQALLGTIARVDDALSSLRPAAAERTLRSRFPDAYRSLARLNKKSRRQLANDVLRLKMSAFFDSAWYLRQYPDVASAGMEAAVHYLMHGVKEGRHPSPLFDGAWYLATYPDVADGRRNPLIHFIKYGYRERRLFKLAAAPCSIRRIPATEEWPANGQRTQATPEGGGLGRMTQWLGRLPPAPHELMDSHAQPDAIRRSTVPASREESVDIVICVHNAPLEANRCIDSVVRCTKQPYQIIVVDDGSSAETAQMLETFAKAHQATLIRHESALGYTRAANVGLSHSVAPWVVLLNSDTVVAEHWLDRMVTYGRRNSRVGLIGPLSNTASWQSVPDLEANGDWAENALPADVDVERMAELIAAASAGQGIPLPFLNGFCLMIRRELIDDIGIFDEETFGAGYGEENDYCIRARANGWQLFVADDVYVYHAQSRSYTREKRLELSKTAASKLAAKHNAKLAINPQAGFCRHNLGLAAIRARADAIVRRQALLDAGRRAWNGLRVAFILPVDAAAGGANVVIQEARALIRMGIECFLINLSSNKIGFENAYSNLGIPVIYALRESDIPDIVDNMLHPVQAVIATLYASVFWLPPPKSGRICGYYVQDFEPMFFSSDDPERLVAMKSYGERSDLRMFTKSAWNARQVSEAGYNEPVVVGPSVDIDQFRPYPFPFESQPRPIQVCAMIRPSSVRRAPRFTLELLNKLKARFGDQIDITVFGCEHSDLASLGTSTSCVRNLGKLTPSQVAALLECADVFLDLSEYQAMGLTALEAMASGCAVMVPSRGGAVEYAFNGRNAIVVDTTDFAACLAAATHLLEDGNFRARVRIAAVAQAAAFPPELAAFRLMQTLFGNSVQSPMMDAGSR